MSDAPSQDDLAVTTPAKVDARRLSPVERRERKELVLRLHQEGLRVGAIVERTGLSYGTVSTVIKAGLYVPPKVPGRKQGDGRALTPEQERELRIAIRQRTPRSIGLVDSIWSRDAVTALFKARTGTVLSRRGVDGYLARWGVRVAHSDVPPSRRCVNVIRKWWQEHEVDVQEDASKRRAVILWLNRPLTLDAREWHALDSPPSNKRIQLLSAETGKGTLYWQLSKLVGNPEAENGFLDNLRKHLRRNLILVRSSQLIYHRAEVLAYVDQSRDVLRLLPPQGHLRIDDEPTTGTG